MEETNKSTNDHGENKKMVIKIGGGGGGGGIGAVVLLSGALAAAALVSLFAVRQKSRSSGEDHRGRSQNSSPEINNKSDKGEADISEGEEGEVELEYDSTATINIYAHSLKLDDKTMVETDAAISDCGFVVKREIPVLAEKQMPEDEKDKVEFTKEDVSDDYSNDQTEAVNNVDMEKKEMDDFCNGNGEIINEQKCVEMDAKEEGNVDLSGDGIGNIQEAITVSERLGKDEGKTLLPLPLFEGHDIQQENVDGDDEEGSPPTHDVEMVRVDEATVGSQEDKVEYTIEEKSIEEDEKCYVSDAGIVPKQNHQVDDLAGETLEVCDGKALMQFDDKKNAAKEIEIELISLEFVEAARDAANGEAPHKVEPDGNGTSVQYPVPHPDDSKEDVKRENEKVADEELINKKRSVQFVGYNEENDGDRVKDLNDEAALSNESCRESSWEDLWPQKIKLMKYEVGGKIQEDKNSENFPVVADEYAVELERVKDYPTNSMRWRMIIWTVSVLASLSCAWFFDLSFARLCLVVFLAGFLLEIYGCSLLNRQHDQCLLAAEEDLAYDYEKPRNKLAKP